MEDKKNNKRSMAMLIASMAIWGSIGIFRRYIPLPSSVLAASRGFVGTAFLTASIAAGVILVIGGSIASET